MENKMRSKIDDERSKKDRGDIIRDIEKVLKGFKEIEFAYCFGETFNDIDIALIKDISPYEGLKLSLKVGRELERVIKPRKRIDVKILTKTSLRKLTVLTVR